MGKAIVKVHAPALYDYSDDDDAGAVLRVVIVCGVAFRVPDDTSL